MAKVKLSANMEHSKPLGPIQTHSNVPDGGLNANKGRSGGEKDSAVFGSNNAGSPLTMNMASKSGGQINANFTSDTPTPLTLKTK
jgi:hypothetical protein|tara:strand:- start:579 stop:833 length:255 start_codon:yes stop_codon:yes gene_type:complete